MRSERVNPGKALLTRPSTQEMLERSEVGVWTGLAFTVK